MQAKKFVSLNSNLQKIDFGELGQVYFIKQDKNIDEFIIQKEEVSEIKWVSLDELKKLFYSDKWVPYDIKYKEGESFVDTLVKSEITANELEELQNEFNNVKGPIVPPAIKPVSPGSTNGTPIVNKLQSGKIKDELDLDNDEEKDE